MPRHIRSNIVFYDKRRDASRIDGCIDDCPCASGSRLYRMKRTSTNSMPTRLLPPPHTDNVLQRVVDTLHAQRHDVRVWRELIRELDTVARAVDWPFDYSAQAGVPPSARSLEWHCREWMALVDVLVTRTRSRQFPVDAVRVYLAHVASLVDGTALEGEDGGKVLVAPAVLWSLIVNSRQSK